MYTVSQKNCVNLFLSELRQISTNFDKFWQEDGTLCEDHSFSTVNFASFNVFGAVPQNAIMLGATACFLRPHPNQTPIRLLASSQSVDSFMKIVYKVYVSSHILLICPTN